jgi:uncharacterized protein involved in cysteine biosynthesis
MEFFVKNLLTFWRILVLKLIFCFTEFCFFIKNIIYGPHNGLLLEKLLEEKYVTFERDDVKKQINKMERDLKNILKKET